jgi:hypothetical protein
MSRHPADHRAPSDGSRAKHFLRLARGADTVWRSLWKRPRAEPPEGRRVAEFVRIARGRQV